MPYRIGRSKFCVRFLQKFRSLCTEQRFGGILWCFSERTTIPTKELMALNLNIRYHEGVQFDFENSRSKPCQFILDYLLNDVYSRHVSDLFTKGSHHGNISVILITQNISSEQRQISRTLFNNVGDPRVPFGTSVP